MTKRNDQAAQRTVIKVDYSQAPSFKGKIVAFAFDGAGALLDKADVKSNRIELAISEAQVGRSRLFFAPVGNEIKDFTPTIAMMQRLKAYEASVRKKGKVLDAVLIPDIIIADWIICFCHVKGRVIKGDSGLPVCSAKVHICEVDKFWRLIMKLPDDIIFNLRDDFLKEYDPPMLRRPPLPNPPPVEVYRTNRVETFKSSAKINLDLQKNVGAASNIRSLDLQISPEIRSALISTSAQIVRQTLVANATLLLPFLCIWPHHWWFLRCDEIAVVETDAYGRFETIIPYICTGDKLDLYFWVQYEIDGVWETVLHPPMACHTHWNYQCGTEITLRVWDDRVPACDPEPDLGQCVVQILSIGRQISMSEIQGNGAPVTKEGLTTDDQPFGGKIEPRVWFSRSELRDGKNIKHYRWSYRRLTEGDGTPLPAPGSWTPLTRAVVRHYAKLVPGGITHQPVTLGPVTVGTQPNLVEIKPASPPAGGIEWTVMDEREDLASGHFESDKLGIGTTASEKALNAAGKYELKLELFDSTGAVVDDWESKGIALKITNIVAPFGTDPVTSQTAPAYNRIVNGAGKTKAFRMVLRVDNNFCYAKVEPVTGIGLHPDVCGFIEFDPGAKTKLTFKAVHPNNFATFSFSLKRGVSTYVTAACASGRTGTPLVPTNDLSHTYTLGAPGTYSETFDVAPTLLNICPRAAFSEALHVWTMTTDGYGRLWNLDHFDHDAFALTPVPAP